MGDEERVVDVDGSNIATWLDLVVRLTTGLVGST